MTPSLIESIALLIQQHTAPALRANSMRTLRRKHIIQFTTSLSLEEFSLRIWQLVDFNYQNYKSTAQITKDFFGDVLSPGKFSIRKKPLVPGLLDVFTNIGPYIEIEVEQGKAKVSISDNSYIPQLIFVFILVGLTLGYIGDFLPELSFLEIVIPILIVFGISCLVFYLTKDRFKSVVKMVERKLIRQLEN